MPKEISEISLAAPSSKVDVLHSGPYFNDYRGFHNGFVSTVVNQPKSLYSHQLFGG